MKVCLFIFVLMLQACQTCNNSKNIDDSKNVSSSLNRATDQIFSDAVMPILDYLNIDTSYKPEKPNQVIVIFPEMMNQSVVKLVDVGDSIYILHNKVSYTIDDRHTYKFQNFTSKHFKLSRNNSMSKLLEFGIYLNKHDSFSEGQIGADGCLIGFVIPSVEGVSYHYFSNSSKLGKVYSNQEVIRVLKDLESIIGTNELEECYN